MLYSNYTTVLPEAVVSLWVRFYNGFNKECQQAKFSLYGAALKLLFFC